MPATVPGNALSEGFYKHDSLPLTFLVVAIPNAFAEEIANEPLPRGNKKDRGVSIVEMLLRRGLWRVRAERNQAKKAKGKRS